MRKSKRDIARAASLTTRRTVILGGGASHWPRAYSADGCGGWECKTRNNTDFWRRIIALRLVRPERGRIFDRAGKIVAGNEQTYRITVVLEEAWDIESVLENLCLLTRLSEDEVRNVRDQIARSRSYTHVTVKDRASWDELAIVAVNFPTLQGVQLEMGLSRVYPFGQDFAHQVGYLGAVSDSDLNAEEGIETLLRLPDYQIGKFGIERAYERQLRGTPGTRRVEINASGRTMWELGLDPPAAEPDLQITLDHHLQNFIQVRLEGHSASAIVLDTTSGDVLACASAPSFDPK